MKTSASEARSLNRRLGFAERASLNSSTDTVVQQITDSIRSRIRDGGFAPGQRLVVGDVTRMLGVSAGPVREAISRLTGEGLIEVVPHRGATVRTFSTDDVREIFQVREMIEGLAARLAAEAVADKPENRARVEAALTELHGIQASESGRFIDHNHGFHELIYELGGNNRATTIASSLTLPIYRLRFHLMLTLDQTQTSMADHDAIAQAILAGDGEAAERAMRLHIRRSGEAMVEAVRRTS